MVKPASPKRQKRRRAPTSRSKNRKSGLLSLTRDHETASIDALFDDFARNLARRLVTPTSPAHGLSAKSATPNFARPTTTLSCKGDGV